MNPFHFGSSTQPLFGVHHPPVASETGCAVVLCYPVGSEYLRAHRAFRQLTSLLVRAGAHVLRFDYLGTGDSWGDPSDTSVAQWVDDVGAAIQELKDTAGVDRVCLAGLRVGGTLAARAGFVRDDVSRIVLWDPVADGAEWLDTLLGNRSHASPPAIGGDGPTPPWPEGTVGVGGFPITPGLAQGIGGLQLAAITPAPAIAVDVLTSSEAPMLRALVEGWAARRGQGDALVRYRCIPSAGDWAVGDRFGSALIPQAIIQGVLRCLTEG